MRNPPGRHLLRLTNRAVRSSSSSSSAPGAGPGASTSAASPRPRAIADGRPLRASSPPPPSAVAAAAAAYWESRALRRDGEEGDWEEVVAGVPGTGEMEEGEEYRVVFWCPPTIDEVTGAVTSIQEVFENPLGLDSDTTDRQTALLSASGHSSGNSSGSDDWIEPAAYVLNSTALLSREHRSVLDAFRLLQKDPTVQAVWDAVMNNEAVQDFRRPLHDGKESDRKGNTGGPAEVLKWVLESAQAKIIEFIENAMKIINMLIHPEEDEDKPDAYSDAVKVSFMLTIFVFIVVDIARTK
ncbi:Uncharacterized conserved protein (UCP012943) [Zea mays]|uniref:Uncharacterized conserved protein (UCP012943) n=1 Tax=Zea mays TaxID=4577 RepID=A0A1D6Q6F6_MAIZE|nr:Uncharacterized conserved protein (UCP012943) [Zea mays]